MPEVAKKLNLTDKQKQQIQDDQKMARKEADDALSADAANRDKKLKDLHESSHKRLHAILTPEQITQWKEMIGTPFEGAIVIEDHSTAAK